MTPNELPADMLSAAAGVAVASLLAKALPLGPTITTVNGIVRKSLYLVAARNVSDHWKERVLPHYALRILIGSGQLAAYLLAVLGAFVLGFAAVQFLLFDTPDSGLVRLLGWQSQIVTAVFGICVYLYLRLRRR